MKFKIYRLCRDHKTIEKFRLEGAKYNLPEQVLVTGPDYFTFIEDVVRQCKEDYALLCHDDVVVPLDIVDRVAECVQKADDYCGPEGWGVVGNAGVEAISLRTVRFLKDPHTAVIPYKSYPIPVVSIDGNVLLLNIKNLKKNNFKLPTNVRGFHLYDLITLVECYRKGLFALVDSSLYVYHRSGGAQKGFDNFSQSEEFQKYWSDNFINHKIYTINGLVEIKRPNLEYLEENSKDKRSDFYSLVKKQILDVTKGGDKPTINIITRTQLRNLNSLRRLLESISLSEQANAKYLNIKLLIAVNNILPNSSLDDLKPVLQDFSNINVEVVVCAPRPDMAPRLYSVQNVLEKISGAGEQYVWIIDDDDFIFPKELRLMTKYLNPKSLFIGNSESFEEEWNESSVFPVRSTAKPVFYSELGYAKNYLGDNHVPICSVIFPVSVLKDVFATHKLKGDYYEDYALLFLSQTRCNIQYLPILIAGVSHHDQNTIFENDRTHWDYSYTTFVSEITNSGVVNNSEFELNSTLDNYARNYKSGKFLLVLVWRKVSNILGLLFHLKIRTLINVIKSYL